MSVFRAASALVGVAIAGAALAAPALAADTPPNLQPAIIDGSESPQDAPWAARLFNQGQEACTASIIAPEWVLTAQHCVEGAGDAVSFNIGSVDANGGEAASARPGGVHINDGADLALVNIDHPVQTTYAPLGDQSTVAAGQVAQTYGWGATCTDRPETECQSPLLKVANVNVTDTACQDLRGGVAICATRGDGLPAGGDSGGPMFVTASDGFAYQVGVASTSDRAQNTAYTNITQYRDWIASLAGV